MVQKIQISCTSFSGPTSLAYTCKNIVKKPQNTSTKVSCMVGRESTYCNSHYSLYTKFMWGKEGKGLKSLLISQSHIYISSASRSLVYSRERGQETSLLLVNKSVYCPQTINCHKHYFQVSSRITGLCFLGCDGIWTKHRAVWKGSSI